MQTANSLEIDAGKDQRQKEKATEDEMVGWHHQPNGHESEQIPRDSEGQGSLVGYIQCDVGEKLLRFPWTARRSNQPILREINPEYSLEGLMLKLKLQYFGHLI